MQKQKVKFWYIASQNVCLHPWQCRIHPYTDKTISTNCPEIMFFGYQLTNVRDSPQILTFRLLLRSLDQSTVHSCTNVSEQHPCKVINMYNARLFGQLLGKLRQTKLYIKNRLQKRFWWPADFCGFISKGDELKSYKPIHYFRELVFLLKHTHLTQHSQTVIKGRSRVAGEEIILWRDSKPVYFCLQIM